MFMKVIDSLLQDLDSPLASHITSLGPNPFKVLPSGKQIDTNRDFTDTLRAMTQLGLSEHVQNEISKVCIVTPLN